MRPIVYFEPAPDETPLRFAEFRASYRGFEIGKTPAHQLFYLICPPGKVLPAEIGCKFTKFTLLKEAVDSYLEKHPEAVLPDIVIPKPKRLHRRKEKIEITDDPNN